MLIVFIGPDGCGKTTVATAVVQHLRSRGKDVRFFELYFGIVPRFRDIASFVLGRSVGKTHEPGEHLAGMKQAPNNPVKAALYILWYSADYLLGRFCYGTSLKRETVVFARYAHDFGYLRSYSRAPKLFVRLMLLVAPRPDHVFTVHREGERIFEGKPELTVEEIERQQKRIDEMLRCKPYFYVLDGSRGVEDTVAQALAIIEGGDAL